MASLVRWPSLLLLPGMGLFGCLATDPLIPEPSPSPSAGPVTPSPSPTSSPSPSPSEPAHPTGAPPPLATLCARPHANAVADKLCASPRITGLSDLLRALDLGDPELRRSVANGNSTSLVGRRSTPINPRVVTVPLIPQRLADFRAVGFVRGEQFVELVAYDTGRAALAFYLLTFEQACNAGPEGCSIADLQSEKIEHNWTGWKLAEDVDLAGTPIDCLVCHQPQGPGTEKLLRMQELRVPWMHWFPAGAMKLNIRDPSSSQTDTEDVLLPIFREAHGHERQYGGIPLSELLDLDRFAASALEGFIDTYWSLKGGAPPIFPQDNQDFEFNSNQVLQERAQGSRAQWTQYFAEVRSGRRVTVPFYDVDTSDPAKRRAAVAAYLAVERGSAPASTMLDLRDVFSAEAQLALSIRPADTEPGPELLTHFCGRCHNPRLDQSLSRARFDVERLAEMSAEEKKLAIERILLPQDSPYVMPPVFAAELTPLAIEKLKEVLSVTR